MKLMYDEFYGFEEEYDEDEEYEKYLEMVSEEERQRKESGFYNDEDDGEIWLPVVGYEGLYEVSNMGRIRSLDRYKQNHNSLQLVEGKILKLHEKTPNGYLCIGLSKDGVVSNKRINRLVAEAFIPNYENKPMVNHIDTNVQNNKVDNLEWVTQKENLNNPLTKINFSNAKLNNNYAKGNKMSEENKERLRKMMTGRKVSKESIEKTIKTKRERGIPFDTHSGQHWKKDENGKRIYYIDNGGCNIDEQINSK